MPTLVGKEIGPIGFGLMGFTSSWRTQQTPFSDAIKTMRAALQSGCNFWNGGTFYGTPTSNSLHLLHAYFTQYPEDASKVVLSIKGGFDVKTLMPDGSPEGLRKEIDEALRILDGRKSIDVFECGRVDPKTPIEDTVAFLGQCVEEGKIGGVGLSEVGATTIRRASTVHAIAAVEVEFGLFSTDILSNGVASTCAELNIPIVAYSPLGAGFLTGQIKKFEDVSEGQKFAPRFHEENFQKNLKLVEAIGKVAERKGVTSAQLAINWVVNHSGSKGCPIVVPLPGATRVERVEENSKVVGLSEDEMREIGGILESMPVEGARKPKALEHLAWA